MAVMMDDQKAEKVAFLDNTIIRPHTKIEERSSCCFGWSKKKICCFSCLGVVVCLIIAMTVVCLMFFVFKHGDRSGEAAMWETQLSADSSQEDSQVTIDGTYTLQSYDDQYEPYLTALGIPWYVIPLILAASEKLSVQVDGDRIKLHTETSWKTQEMSFELGTMFNMTYGRGMGTMWNVCHRNSPNVLSCRSEEREKGWELLSKMTFSRQGIVNERHFVNDDIKCKKYYKREIEEGEIDFLENSDDDEDEFEEEEDDDW